MRAPADLGKRFHGMDELFRAFSSCQRNSRLWQVGHGGLHAGRKGRFSGQNSWFIRHAVPFAFRLPVLLLFGTHFDPIVPAHARVLEIVHAEPAQHRFAQRVIEERGQKLVLSGQQIESRHEIDPGHRVDHLKREQDPLGSWFIVVTVVSIDRGAQAQIQTECPVNDLGPVADKLFESAFEKGTDIPCGKPV